MKQKRWFVLSMALILLGVTLVSAQHHVDGEEIMLTGEVIDLQCYLLHPDSSRGPSHAKCAKACINKGLPIGLLTEKGDLYLLLAPGHDSVKELVADKAGETVDLKGVVVEQNQLQAFQVKARGSH